MFSLLLALFLGALPFAGGCSCEGTSSQEAFCKADWVSRVKVIAVLSKQLPIAGSKRHGLNNIRYAVSHSKTYKSPEDLPELPEEVLTPTETAACGLFLKAGKEYLLAGRLEAKGLALYMCGQIPTDEYGESTFLERNLQWERLSKNLTEAIGNFGDGCKNGTYTDD